MKNYIVYAHYCQYPAPAGERGKALPAVGRSAVNDGLI